MPVTYKSEGISASRKARELILGSNWGRIQFPIRWCKSQFRTLTVERSPLNALVTKLAFFVSIGWRPIVGGGADFQNMDDITWEQPHTEKGWL